MNKKGFTLIELLVMLVVLGILIGITIPNISGILNNQKLNVTRDDAIKMVDNAKIIIATNNEIKKPKTNECIIFSLSYLDDTKDITTGPNGGMYSLFDSFVIMKRVGSSYKYYVRLVEKLDDGDFGINLADLDDLTSNLQNNVDVITDETNITSEDTIDKIKNVNIINSICPENTIKMYYNTK